MRRKKKRVIFILLFIALILFGVILGRAAFRKLMNAHVLTDGPKTDASSYGYDEPDSGGKQDISSDGQAQHEFVMPVYTGEEVVPINDNVPDFDFDERDIKEYISFSELDELGRAGTASGCIGPSTLGTGERERLGMIRPPGWHTVKYDFIDGLYLYNRCHLIAYELCGVNADERNLITGTRYLNIVGMLEIENRVAWYVRDTGRHVYYRVTPRYEGNNLLATGVQIEAKSVEDKGERICLNVFCFNVQPGVLIDLATGDNELDPDYEEASIRTIISLPGDEESARDTEALRDIPQDADSADVGRDDGSAAVWTGDSSVPDLEESSHPAQSSDEEYLPGENVTYVLNINTMRFHYPDCQSVQDTKPKNRKEFFGTREELIAAGYSPCGRCLP